MEISLLKIMEPSPMISIQKLDNPGVDTVGVVVVAHTGDAIVLKREKVTSTRQPFVTG